MAIKSNLKSVIGHALEILVPSAVRDLEQGVNPDRQQRIKKLILHARMTRAKTSGDLSKGEDALHQYWQTDFAHDFYGRFHDRFEKWFHGAHAPAIEAIIQHARRNGFDRIVEIGCGDGRALKHISAHLPDIDRFIGLDINPKIIDKNTRQYADLPKLQFVSGNALDWIKANIDPRTLYYSYGGVLEYFSEDSLKELVDLIASQAGGTFALVEPVDPTHDLAKERASHLFGEENSFSHNYAMLLQARGFRIMFQDEVFTGKIRWMMMLATSDPA